MFEIYSDYGCAQWVLAFYFFINLFFLHF